MPRPRAACGTESAYRRHVRFKEPIDPACAALHPSSVFVTGERTSAPSPRLTVVPPVAYPTVRCPYCLEREVIEYPIDDVAARLALIRHYGKPSKRACAESALRANDGRLTSPDQ